MLKNLARNRKKSLHCAIFDGRLTTVPFFPIFVVRRKRPRKNARNIIEYTKFSLPKSARTNESLFARSPFDREIARSSKRSVHRDFEGGIAFCRNALAVRAGSVAEGRMSAKGQRVSTANEGGLTYSLLRLPFSLPPSLGSVFTAASPRNHHAGCLEDTRGKTLVCSLTRCSSPPFFFSPLHVAKGKER